MKIEDRPIHSIRPYDKNPRLNDRGVDAVAASIREFGFRQPIVVDEDGVIVVGHTRYKAALKLGLATVPIHVATGLSAAQINAYRIADNQTATLSQWNDELLPLELMELQQMNFDLNLTGFSAEDLLGLLEPATTEGLTDPMPSPSRRTSRRRSRVTCGFLANIASCAVTLATHKTWTGCSTAPQSTWSIPIHLTTFGSSRGRTTPSPLAIAHLD
jgi:ParB-like chromosome segregation protein Spo0J